MKNLNKIIYILPTSQKKIFYTLLIIIFVAALLDTLGVASILPFVGLLSNPELIEKNIYLNNLFKILNLYGFNTVQNFLFIFGFFVFFLLLISLFFKALAHSFQVKFIQMSEYELSKRLVEKYLNQPYSWFLSKNSAELGKNILSEIQLVIGNSLVPFIEIISKGAMIILIISMLILINPKLAFIVGLAISGSYLFIFYFLKRYIKKIGKIRLINNQLRFMAISKAFGAAKEVKVTNLEEVYANSFSTAAKKYSESQASAQVASILPRYILEAVAFGGILLIMLYLILEFKNFNSAVPILALYVFAGYRLMPAFQQIYSSFTQLTYIRGSLDKIFNDLKNLEVSKDNHKNEFLAFNHKISLNKICYSYPDTSRETLSNLSLTIPVKSMVGFIGTTGSGKTTIIDIILGLLNPQEGSLEVDGQTINAQNIRSWQSLIGYVPQNIFLTDDSIASNIALGLDAQNIDTFLVEQSSKIANLHDFVISDLPNKYNTIIGERGVRLSGGQRQRIGIARALYRQPKILIFDEATSALDNQTEEKIMNAINSLSKDVTIIIISHRINTLKNCDVIFKIQEGKIVDRGTFNKFS